MHAIGLLCTFGAVCGMEKVGVGEAAGSCKHEPRVFFHTYMLGSYYLEWLHTTWLASDLVSSA